jgi:hypothetical protein
MHYNPHCFNVSGSSIVLGSDLTLVRTLFMGPGLVVVGIYITGLYKKYMSTLDYAQLLCSTLSHVTYDNYYMQQNGELHNTQCYPH